jgi:hypothetical protein
MNKKWFILAPLGFLVFITLGGFAVLYLWNWLLPPLFGWPLVNFWQALGLLALSRILFGGFGMHGGPGRHWRRRWMHKGFEDMTPEERERFEHGIHSHPHSEEKA